MGDSDYIDEDSRVHFACLKNFPRPDTGPWPWPVTMRLIGSPPNVPTFIPYYYGTFSAPLRTVRVLSIKNTSPVALPFLKAGMGSDQCGTPSATVVLLPNETTTQEEMTAIFGPSVGREDYSRQQAAPVEILADDGDTMPRSNFLVLR